MAAPAPPLPALDRFARPALDYAALQAAIAACEQAIRSTRQALDRLAPSPRPTPTAAPTPRADTDANRNGSA